MNHLRRAAEDGARLRIFRPFVNKERREAHNPSREVKKELGLSGRQLKRLRKAARRAEAERQRQVAATEPRTTGLVRPG